MRYLFLLLPVLILVGCGQKKELGDDRRPNDSIVPRGEMIYMLADLHVIESGLRLMKHTGTDAKQESDLYYAAFFSKYKISRKCFYENLEYYKRDQAVFIKLYDDVLVELDRRGIDYNKKTSPVPE